MPRNGSGTYSKPNGTTFVNNTLADADDVNTLADDIATALTGSFAKNGEATATGDFNMGGSYKLTSLAAGSAAGHSVRYEQVFSAAITNTIDDATNNDITRNLALVHTTSGTPGTGIGIGISFTLETAAAHNELVAAFDVVSLDLTDTSEDVKIVLKAMVAGALASCCNFSQGVWVEGATGGDKGAGTFNAETVYHAGVKQPAYQYFTIALSDETTALSAGTGKGSMHLPYAFTLVGVSACLTTAQGSGNIFTIDMNESGTTVLSTKLTIDNNELTSTSAATPAVISDASLAANVPISFDIDQVGDGTAKGLKVTFWGYPT